MAIHLGKYAVHPIEKSLAVKCILSPRTELLQVEYLGSDSNFSPRDCLFSLRQSSLSPGATIHHCLPAALPSERRQLKPQLRSNLGAPPLIVSFRNRNEGQIGVSKSNCLLITERWCLMSLSDSRMFRRSFSATSRRSPRTATLEIIVRCLSILR
jgi:hypothetical protein